MNNTETKDSSIKPCLTMEEKLKCLKEIRTRNKRILYVYEKSLIPNSEYNYKVYLNGLIWFVSSANKLFEGDLVKVKVNLYTIVENNFGKDVIKKIVHENTNFINYMIKMVGEADVTN